MRSFEMTEYSIIAMDVGASRGANRLRRPAARARQDIACILL